MTEALEIDEEPRPRRGEGPAPAPPKLLLVEQMRRDNRALEQLLAALAGEQFELEQALGQAARQADAATANEWKAVEIIAARLRDLLAGYVVSTEDPTGKDWSDAMRSDYQLIGFTKREDVRAARVAHVLAPLVRRFGRVIRKGAVTVDAPASGPSGADADSNQRQGD